jgi:hypothetical protein
MANGRSIDRLAHRVASVTSVRPDRRRAQMAKLRRHDPWPGSGSDLGFVFLVEGVAELLWGSGPVQMGRHHGSSW